MKRPHKTAWDRSGKWYNKIVGSKGHYYHEHIVLPGALRLLDLQKNDKILDIGCGQGILAKKIPSMTFYTGIDLSKSLISIARRNDANPKHIYLLQDATKPLELKNRDYTKAAAILSLQNMENALNAIKQISQNLINQGKLVIVLNHPCFRIPRQSGWGIGESRLQYRYINRYLSPLKIPITMHPGERPTEITWTFHEPLSYYAQSLKENGFLIETIEEWISDKKSQGPAAKMEDRARAEIPLFLAISAIRYNPGQTH